MIFKTLTPGVPPNFLFDNSSLACSRSVHEWHAASPPMAISYSLIENSYSFDSHILSHFFGLYDKITEVKDIVISSTIISPNTDEKHDHNLSLFPSEPIDVWKPSLSI